MDLDQMVAEAQTNVQLVVETSYKQHLSEMKQDFKDARKRLGLMKSVAVAKMKAPIVSHKH